MTLEDEIIQALEAGQWLDFVSGYNLRDDADEASMRALAIGLHNSGRFDLLTAIDGFDGDGDSFRFYEIQQFYSDALPQLAAEPEEMLKAVRRLGEEGGPNRDGAFIALPFRDWCKGTGRATAIAALLDFSAPRDGWYLRLALEGASTNDPGGALDWALALIADKPGPQRIAALEALGSLGPTPALATHAIAALGDQLEHEADDQILGLGIYAAIELHGRGEQANPADTAKIVAIAATRGGTEMRRRAMQALWFQWKAITPAILDQLIGIAETVEGSDPVAVDHLDHALYQMTSGEHVERAIAIVRTVLSANRGTLTVHSFDSFEHQLLTKHRARFDTLTVEWFVSGDRALGEAVMALVCKVHGAPMVLRPDLTPFGYGLAELIFLARKAVGYLFTTPISAASLLMAIMRTGVSDAIKGATELLFDPLLVNYSGELGEHLREAAKDMNDPASPHVAAALQQLETYLDGLRAVGRVKALDPSERERMIEWRRRQQEMEDAMKAGEKESIFSQLATKVVLLYGNRSITYVPPFGDEPGPERRMVTEMQSHHHSHEYARMIVVDPHGIDLMLRHFRVERLPK
ncbi:hypothetical protein [Edaphosphingomonas haloaromaticamans]|uniref:Uncharacterized protein n=1 Tax=Edaphosphingomonas haloaromaticamans TaxID=653954 RepID=A0A1S1HDG4_9SPHN|nr:hypothetical protein [Sphingomonas haloaromaticamans]OHT20235.1 hypothetical protein BHE75_02230 [Sphingomonas haloaromaticamans]